MLLDEDPAALIHECIGNFNIAPDRHALDRINSSLTTLQRAREHRLHEAELALKKLSRHYSNVESQHALTLQSHNPAHHASSILALDTQKFKVAKAASDLEIEGERLEQELEGLKQRLEELDSQGVEGGREEDERGTRAGGEDEVILKLKVYHTLGIDVEQDPSSGLYNKAVIRNTQKGDVHVVNIDPKFSRFFYANYFWEAV